MEKRKEKFEKWLVSQTQPNGQHYKAKTAYNYILELSTTSEKFKNWSFKEKDLFFVTDASKFEEMQERIRAHPEYVRVNNSANGTLSAAMKKYAEFLRCYQERTKTDKDILEKNENFNDEDKLVFLPSDNETMEEGSKYTATINKYERNPQAREASIMHFGYSCQICGFNFEEYYGEIGRQFIHVHHIIPLNKIGENYQVDPLDDLIPVCPNCHAMLHSKDSDGFYPTVAELKDMIAKRAKDY